MMRLSRLETRMVLSEIGASIAAGLLAAVFIPAVAMQRIDDMVVTFMSIILAAAIPGVALTAAAVRPLTESPLEAQSLGADLESQVRFWFSFLFVGGTSVVAVLIGGALDWTLITPRPNFVPAWVPDGSAWLVLLAVGPMFFTVIRARHVANAVISVVSLSTTAHVERAQERRRQLHMEIGESIRSTTTDASRGAPLSPRERQPRPTN